MSAAGLRSLIIASVLGTLFWVAVILVLVAVL